MFDFKTDKNFLVAMEVVKKIVDSGYEAYLVGGCVRDILLNKQPHDYDITTNIELTLLTEIFDKTIPTGLKHGTITVIYKSYSFEITRYRLEKDYQDGRHPNYIEFNNVTLKDDLSRRDFTINGLAMNYNGDIIDYFDGQKDLKHRIIRTIRSPIDRFNEDHLRLFRALRFSACLDFDISEETDKAIKELGNEKYFNKLSKDRIRDELSKLLCSTNKMRLNYILNEYKDIFATVIPDLRLTFGFDQKCRYHLNSLYAHIVNVTTNSQPYLETRLAALLHDIGKIDVVKEDEEGNRHYYGHSLASAARAKVILVNLKYPNKVINHVTKLVRYHDYLLPLDTKNAKSLIKRFFVKLDTNMELFEKALDLIEADRKDHLEQNQFLEKNEIRSILKNALDNNEPFTLKDLAINGTDLLELNIPSIYIGKILNKTLDLSLRDKIKNEKEDLLTFAKQYFKSLNEQ